MMKKILTLLLCVTLCISAMMPWGSAAIAAGGRSVSMVVAAGGAGDVDGGEENAPPQVTTGKGLVTISSDYFGNSVYAGGDIYLLSNALYVLRAGADALETVAEYEEDYRYIAKEDFAALTPEALEMAKRTPTSLVSDGEVLYGLSGTTGVFGVLDAQGYIDMAQAVQLDWSDMFAGGNLRSIDWLVLDGEDLYAALTSYSQNGYSSEDMQVYHFDVQSGEKTQTALSGGMNLCPYKDGKLLAHSQYGDIESGLYLVSAKTLELGEMLLPVVYGQEDDPVGMSYNAGGIAYSAQEDAIYFVESNTIKRYAQGEITEVTYISANYGSNISNAQVTADSYFGSGWEGTYLRSLKAEDQPERTLRISGGYMDETMIAFNREHPNTPVVLDSAWYTGSEAIRTDMMSGDKAVDIYVIDVQSGLRALMEKGYIAPLSSSAFLAEDVASMYPQLSEALTKDGKLYAYPQSFSANPWAINTKLWEQFDMGEIPTTFGGFVDIINRWEEEYAQDNPGYAATSLYSGGETLLSQALINYIYQYETKDEPLSFNTPAFIEAIEQISAIDIETPDFDNMSDSDWQEYWQKQNLPTLFSTNVYDAIRDEGMYVYDEETGSYETVKTMNILPPAFEEGGKRVLPVSLSVFVVNPDSLNADLAVEFLEYYAKNMQPELDYCLHPDRTEPVRYAHYEDNLKRMNKNVTDLETQLAEADEGDKKDIQGKIDQTKASIADMEENEWLISADSLARYRELAPHMALLYDSQLLNYDSAGLTVLQDLLMRLLDGQIDIHSFVREADQKLKMIYLEGK